MQSQTTFATLAKDEEGHWMPRVIKQKIWVDGTSYELQEIYGIENSSAGRSGESGKQVRAQHRCPCLAGLTYSAHLARRHTSCAVSPHCRQSATNNSL